MLSPYSNKKLFYSASFRCIAKEVHWITQRGHLYFSTYESNNTRVCGEEVQLARKKSNPLLPTTKVSFRFSSLFVSKRHFSMFKKRENSVKVDAKTFDKEQVHYSGKFLGLDADNAVFYLKVGGCITLIIFFFYFFVKGCYSLTRFNLQTVARFGFIGGFFTCLLGYSTIIAIVRRRAINVNAVYNQSIALVMHHDRVRNVLGPHPRTGEFKTYALSGGFKLPLLRRIRSGSYEMSDFLGLKQRRLQMLFVLKNQSSGCEALVACDVRKESTGIVSSADTYKSLSVTLSDPKKEKSPEIIVLVGRPEDIVHYNMIS